MFATLVVDETMSPSERRGGSVIERGGRVRPERPCAIPDDFSPTINVGPSLNKCLATGSGRGRPIRIDGHRRRGDARPGTPSPARAGDWLQPSTRRIEATTANAWVLCDRGRLATRSPSGNVGNGVDGPVLRWAASLRRVGEPFVWVTDGQVTDSHDHPDALLTRQCAELVQRHRIRLARDLVRLRFGRLRTNRANTPAQWSLLWASGSRSSRKRRYIGAATRCYTLLSGLMGGHGRRWPRG